VLCLGQRSSLDGAAIAIRHNGRMVRTRSIFDDGSWSKTARDLKGNERQSLKVRMNMPCNDLPFKAVNERDASLIPLPTYVRRCCTRGTEARTTSEYERHSSISIHSSNAVLRLKLHHLSGEFAQGTITRLQRWIARRSRELLLLFWAASFASAG
jgi:hypothetical protein